MNLSLPKNKAIVLRRKRCTEHAWLNGKVNVMIDKIWASVVGEDEEG